MKNKYRFNVKKCVIFTPITKIHFTLHHQSIPKADTFEYLVYTFNHKGIDSVKHFQRMANKVETASLYFCSLGLNFKDLELKTNINLFKSFIRIRLEYGLAITIPCKQVIKITNSSQYKAICRMLSIQYQGTACDTIHLAGLTEMEERARILMCKYLLKIQDLTPKEEFLIRNIVSNEDEWMKRIKEQAILKENPAEDKKEFLKRVSKEIHEKNIMMLSKKVGQRTLEYLRLINRSRSCHGFLKLDIDRRIKKTLLLWILKKIIGKPKKCRQCDGIATQAHVAKCQDNMKNELKNIMATNPKEEFRYIPEIILSRMDYLGKISPRL